MRSLLLALCSCSIAAPIAHADTLQSFTFQGVLDTGSVTGSISIDTSSGVITGASFNIMAPGGASRSIPGPISTDVYLNETEIFLNVPNVPPDGFFSTTLNLPVVSLVGYDGGALCTDSTPCGGDFSGVVYEEHEHDLLTGSISKVATTPEPSTFALLGTGALGVFGVGRQRLRASAA